MTEQNPATKAFHANEPAHCSPIEHHYRGLADLLDQDTMVDVNALLLVVSWAFLVTMVISSPSTPSQGSTTKAHGLATEDCSVLTLVSA